MRVPATKALAAVLLAACSDSPSPGKTQRHVFLIVMENHTPEHALSGPFMASLADKYGVAENYHAITHPSVPNYLPLTSGSTWRETAASFHMITRVDLETQITKVGVPCRHSM